MGEVYGDAFLTSVYAKKISTKRIYFWFKRPVLSPTSGLSTFITSAPKSQSTIVPNGPAKAQVRSKILRFSKGPDITVLLPFSMVCFLDRLFLTLACCQVVYGELRQSAMLFYEVDTDLDGRGILGLK